MVLSVPVLALLLAYAPIPIQSRKLNGPLAKAEVGRVDFARTSSDGRWAVYLGSQESETRELFSVSVEGNRAPVRLSRPPSSGTLGTWAFAIGPDSRGVVHLDVDGLHVAPIDGSAPPLLLERGQVRDFQIDPSAAWVVYRRRTGVTQELFSVPIDASRAPVRLNDALASGGGVEDDFAFALGPDDARVLYLADAGRDGVFELYGAPIDGGAPPMRLNGALGSRSDVLDFRCSPDGHTVAYRADQERNGRFDLFLVSANGGRPAFRLSDPAHLDVQEGYAFTPDGSWLVYRAGNEDSARYQAYGVRLDAPGTPVPLSPQLAGGGSAFDLRLSTDSRQIVYLGEHGFGQPFELYSAALDASRPPLRLDPGPESVSLFELTPDGTVVFGVDPLRIDGLGIDRILSTPIRGGSLELVAENSLEHGLLTRFLLDQDGTSVVYLGQDAGGELHLFAAPADGSRSPRQLTGLDGEPEAIEAFELAGSHVLYRADQDPLDELAAHQLLRVALDGETRPVRLDRPRSGGFVVGDVLEFALTSEGRGAVFATRSYVTRLDDEIYGVRLDAPGPVRVFPEALASGKGWRVEQLQLAPGDRHALFQAGPAGERSALYSAALDGLTPPVRLTEPADESFYGAVNEFRISPDGNRVAFSAFLELEGEWDNRIGLYGRPIDGNGEAKDLDGLPEEEVRVGPFAFTPDGAAVVFLAGRTDGETASGFELYRGPADGSSPPVKLSAALVAGGSVREFRLDPRGQRAVYAAALDDVRLLELYSVPLDGSAAPVELNSPFPSGSGLWDDPFPPRFQIGQDGARVVYCAQPLADRGFELFSAPLDASEEAVRLNSDLIEGGRVSRHFAFTPDCSRIVYLADQATDETYELFSVPSDGSAAPVRVHDELAVGGDVLRPPLDVLDPEYLDIPFQISPDGSSVVYVADAKHDEVYELFRAPIDGTRPPVRLSAPAQPFCDVHGAFAFSPDGSTVVFVADAVADERLELFVASCAGGHVRRLNGKMVAGGDVASAAYERGLSFRIDPEGSSVFYLADQDTDEAFEFYVSALLPRRRMLGH